MKSFAAGKFKAHCLAIMDAVQSTGEPVVVTKHGQPVVKVVPAKTEDDSIFGFLANEAEIVGDIESPVVPMKDWSVAKERRRR